MDYNNYSAYHIEQWIIRIKQQANDESLDNILLPKCILHQNIKSMIWSFCSELSVNSFGVPGCTCRVIERYVEENIKTLSALENEAFKIYLRNNFPIILAGAIIISSWLHHIQPTNPTDVTKLFFQLGITEYNEENIINSMNEIMSVSEYHFPAWTTLRISELLAHCVGIPATMAPFLRTIVNIAEFRSWQISRDVIAIFNPNNLGNYRVLSMHLAASCVYATAKFFHFNMNYVLPQLTTLVHTHEIYLMCLADNILHYSQN